MTDFLCLVSPAGLVRIYFLKINCWLDFFAGEIISCTSLTIEVKSMKPLPFDLAFLIYEDF